MNNQINKAPDLGYLDLSGAAAIHYQLGPAQLIEASIRRKEGQLTDTGALAIDTGEFTGRSPKDRFIVDDHISHDAVHWGPVNFKFDGAHFHNLWRKMTGYLAGKEIFVRDAAACEEEKYRIRLRVITETAYQNLFVHSLLIRPEAAEPERTPEWTIIAAPGFRADPEKDGTRQKNFTIISFSKKMILIGGTGYTGEIKKAVFTILNFLLPHEHRVLPMHCAANTGRGGDTALFFGLSGTGKTTLSSDPDRRLIGDDEHGWSDSAIFNFEGGCYAKCSGLTVTDEPQIYNAIHYGALLENINFLPGTRSVNYQDIAKTENTRVAYPLSFVSAGAAPLIGDTPKHIFFLTADAFGVLPPIARLSTDQAMYYFLSGYTAKIAGTENGITEPVLTFSACYGEAFLPLSPVIYAKLLGEKIKSNAVSVWMVNTGWTGGAYGTGRRISLSHTRALIRAALNGTLDEAEYHAHPHFGLRMPRTCPAVPPDILDPRNTWKDKDAYEDAAVKLAAAFTANFRRYLSAETTYLLNAAPLCMLAV
ncbi:phosphoenolpyruvate carboxykinase (ATP) [Inquilinus sp. KBS0705]|nr:phosphoenolpyruvate carboxykinase (ATP) [Inquilinus sp. KBS0705]